ncbi:hypothetical protein BD309DRAFT_956464 [Dichomitus squalens]|nr:hypothetical protein BD309DRAFT_956464 [Dichomitus squalens]
MGFEGLWATRTLAPSKRPDKSQLGSAQQASTDPSDFEHTNLPTTWLKHGWMLGGH